MFKKALTALSLILVLGVVGGSVAYAQGTPDGETPANEGVCDELVGLTPGLYGLCVAFCEAQDCEATLDPATGEVTYSPDCRPSNSKVLDNYNRRRAGDDPPMPCVNVAVSECPCWTEDELDLIADGQVFSCAGTAAGYWRLTGFDALVEFGVDFVEAILPDSVFPPAPTIQCSYQENTPSLITRRLAIDQSDYDACVASLETECADRGF